MQWCRQHSWKCGKAKVCAKCLLIVVKRHMHAHNTLRTTTVCFLRLWNPLGMKLCENMGGFPETARQALWVSWISWKRKQGCSMARGSSKGEQAGRFAKHQRWREEGSSQHWYAKRRKRSFTENPIPCLILSVFILSFQHGLCKSPTPNANKAPD